MAIADNDPRVFFAAERTLLAWVRTGITIMALGFVVARFGLFVELLAMQGRAAPTQPFVASLIGIVFVVAGALSILIASVQHGRFVRTLSPQDLPPGYSRAFAVVLSQVVAVAGVALSLYLLVGH